MEQNNGDSVNRRKYRERYEVALDMWEIDLERSDELEEKVRCLELSLKTFQKALKELDEMVKEEEKKCVCAKCWKPMIWAAGAASLLGVFLHQAFSKKKK